ncbi:MAG: hypothetical protein LCI03_14155 [Actinobacteria bacterium]|nr:hypothetical protein [Actinomycetota bacterium]
MGDGLSRTAATWRLGVAIVLLAAVGVGTYALAADPGAGYANLEANSSAPYRQLVGALSIAAWAGVVVGLVSSVRSLRRPGDAAGVVVTVVLALLATACLAMIGVAIAHGGNVSA